ncbi:hypothetical protein NDU88_002292 [Pleurodeles waltl]|uniref:Uncharacterized protein n=1 Tax=Pleurodeles waltl TaxID=8319 RepID=A0AAV7UX64_PLEWA|nr:hypothetical protein NDU88_002292 [Pleurodeles waltl]
MGPGLRAACMLDHVCDNGDGMGPGGHECNRQDGRSNTFSCEYFLCRSAPIKTRVYGVPSPRTLRTLQVYSRRSTHCQNLWEDLRRWAQKMAEGQLKMASQRGRGARQTLTCLMARILAELDGRLGASQQQQGGEYSALHYCLRLVGCYLGGGCGPVDAPRPGLTLQSRSYVGQGSDVKVLQPS